MSEAGTVPVEEYQSYGPRHAAGLLGHAAAERTLLAAWRSGRMPHAWLITGPKGIGKATLAFRFARHVLAAAGWPAAASPPTADSLEMVPADPVFRAVAGFSHPGLLTIERQWDPKRKVWQSVLNVEAVRAMGRFFSMKAAPGAWRIAIIDAADDMNRSAANAALKIVEEPPQRGLVFLVSHAPGGLLPTIRSRCRVLALQPIDEAAVVEIVGAQRPDLAPADRAVVARLADGSPGRALALADAGGAALYRGMIELLADLPKLDLTRLDDFAGRFSRRAADAEFAAAAEMMRGWVARLVKAAGPPQGAGDLVPGEGALLARLGANLGLEPRLALWDKVGGLLNRADGAYLDRKQVLMSAFLAIERAARA
jgi:DNA polymerase III subunit delta'